MFLNILDQKKYSWDDFGKIKKGYKAIMGAKQIDLSNLEVFTVNKIIYEEVEEKTINSGHEGEEDYP
ncbi:MAG: hypothetical protein M0Q88_05830 [Bacilli bacterium]|nr:hypothetical protein [Bacilli bacterium]